MNIVLQENATLGEVFYYLQKYVVCSSECHVPSKTKPCVNWDNVPLSTQGVNISLHTLFISVGRNNMTIC